MVTKDDRSIAAVQSSLDFCEARMCVVDAVHPGATVDATGLEEFAALGLMAGRCVLD